MREAMETFDSTKKSLNALLQEIKEGKIQLPDFQRGWVWDDDHIRDLLASIAKSFPIGAVMLLETGGDVNFQTRPVEGLEGKISENYEPEELILDGQQRLTTLTQAIALDEPVHTRTSRKKPIDLYYYIDICKALEMPNSLEESIVTVDQERKKWFRRTLELDLSSTDLECEKLHFPCNQILNSNSWETTLFKRRDDSSIDRYLEFRTKVLEPFRNYQIPIISIKKEISKEAICTVFEKVNTGGVELTVFELVTASYAAEGFNLRDDWFGSNGSEAESRKKRLEQRPILEDVKEKEFLQALTLLYTWQQRESDLLSGKTGHSLQPISAKRSDVLQLPLAAWEKWADDLEEGFLQVAQFLWKECFHTRKELPYSTQLVPMAAIFVALGNRWRKGEVYDKISRWYWSGVLGELYGGSIETRMANDFEDIVEWIKDDSAIPRTVREANFQLNRFDTLRTRQSAAYKGINVLVIRNGSRDWYWKDSIKNLDIDEVALDIHHIFPRKWCENRGKDPDKFDSILNKTPISYKANRRIGSNAPSDYVAALQEHISDENIDGLLESHSLSADLLKKDDFDGFLENRRLRLSELVSKAMGKPVTRDS